METLTKAPLDTLRGDELEVAGGITPFMRRQASGLTPDIHGRELYENVRVFPSAKNLHGHIIWDRVKSKGVYDMAYTDDGPGMDEATMDRLGNVLGTAIAEGKSDDLYTGNFNWGMRITALSMCHHVVACASTLTPTGERQTRLSLLASNGRLEAKKFTYDIGGVPTTTRAIPGPHFQAVFKDIIEDLGFDPIKVHEDYLTNELKSLTGTTVMLIGSVQHGHTYLGSHGHNRPHTRGSDGNLNKRLWTVPEGLYVAFTEFHSDKPETWPTERAEVRKDRKKDEPTSSGQLKRGVQGAKRYIEDPTEGGYVGGDGEELHITSGPLAGSRIWWALRGDIKAQGGLAPFNDRGYMALLHKNELFHHVPSAKYHEYRRWGITERSVRDRLFIVVEPPTMNKGSNGVKMTAIRTTLEWQEDGSIQPTENVYEYAAEYFRANMPDKVEEAIKKARGDYEPDGTSDDEAAARARFIERYKDRLRRARLKRVAGGSRSVDPTDAGGTARDGVGPSPANFPNLPGGGSGGMGGAATYGAPGSSEPAEPILAAGDLPKFSTTRTEFDEDWMIAQYVMEPAKDADRTIYLNVNHQFVLAYIDYQIEKRDADGWTAAENVIKTLVYEAYRDILWGCVAQAKDQKAAGCTDHQVRDMFLSDSALTTACMGVAHLDALVGPRLGPSLSKLGPRTTAA